jgi:catechol-2,3-dioxygenase
MQETTYDRTTQDVANIVALEHLNVQIPDQATATAFFVQGLGFTRDPYVMVGTENMWINIGQQQFHLPTGSPQIIRGQVGLVLPDLDALTARLESQREKLAGTAFAWSVEDKHVAVTCPWGNRFRCFPPGPAFGDVTLGLMYVEFPVPPGHAHGIARFYRQIMGTTATTGPDNGGPAAHVKVGHRQELVFRETAGEIRPYSGYHIAIYITDFSGPHRRLAERGLVTEESNESQYRFETIVDPDTGRALYQIQHEVRSFCHPMAFRPLVNRNPAQRQATYQRGRDAFVPAGC